MAKLVVLFLAALAFQATIAERYETYGEDKLVKYLDETKDFTLFLRNEFPEQRLAFKTITTHFQRYAVMVEEMMLKLREESFVRTHDSDKTFKPVMHMLEEIYTLLKKMTLYTDMTDKKTFVMDLETLFERLHEIVRVTYTTFPEFRFTVKYLIVDFMTHLHEIRTHFMYMTGKTTELVPTTMLMKIREYTRECTEIIKEFNHPTQMKVALRGYLRFVREILHKLEVETLLGDKEFDVLMHTLTNKLRDIVFPLMQITMTEEYVDMKMIKTVMITRFFEVVEVFEQMMHIVEMKHMPTEVTMFVEKMFYNYYYALETIYNEMKFSQKIGFFTPEYYNMEHYHKYGYGLYEKLFEKLYLTPFTYKTETYSLFPKHKYPVERFEHVKMPRFEMNMMYNKDFDRFDTPKELFMHIEMLLKDLLVKLETVDMHMFEYYAREFVQILDVVYKQLRPVHDDKTVEEFRMFIKQMKMYFEQMPIGEIRMFFITSLKMFTVELYKLTMVEKFEHVMLKHIFSMYTNFLHKMTVHPMERTTYFTESKTYKDLMMQMHVLTTKIYEIKDFKTVPMTMYMRQFVTILEHVIDMMYKHIDYKYENKMVHEIFMNLKQMKMELEHFTYFGGMMSHTYKMRFVQYIKYFTMEMEKMMTVEELPIVMMKDIYMRYVNFLQKFYFEINKYSVEYPVKTYSTMYETKTMMPYFMTRYMKY